MDKLLSYEDLGLIHDVLGDVFIIAPAREKVPYHHERREALRAAYAATFQAALSASGWTSEEWEEELTRRLEEKFKETPAPVKCQPSSDE
jgi:hypothetical protein